MQLQSTTLERGPGESLYAHVRAECGAAVACGTPASHASIPSLKAIRSDEAMRRCWVAIFCRFVQSSKHHSATASQLLNTNAIDSAGTT